MDRHLHDFLRVLRSLPLICILWCGAAGLTAQQSNLVFERMGAERGFPMGLFDAVTQDSRGFIWAGGYAGLIRHDGYGVVHYVNDALDSTSIGDNKVSVILEGRAGEGLWIGTQNGLNYFNRKTETFTRYLQGRAKGVEVVKHYILDLCELESGLLWVLLGYPNELGLFDPPTRAFRKLDLSGYGPINALRCSQDGTVWAAGDKGLFTLDAASLRLQPVLLATADGHPLDALPLRYIAEGAAGMLWLGSENSIIRYDRQAGTAQRIFIPFPLDEQSNTRNVNAILMNRNGGLWCGASDGLYRYDPSGAWEVSRHAPGFERSLSSSVINSIYEDHSGTIWLATLAGINLLHPAAEVFGRFRNSYQGEI
jgi:ligand-binding sensor domain-containing protein